MKRRKSTIQSFLKLKETFPYKQKQNNYDNIVAVIRTHNPIPNVAFETLINDYKKYYDSNLIKIEQKISIEIYKSILEIEHKLELLMQKVIIGNDEIDIAKMINELENKKWVEEGIAYLDHSKTLQHCPFCQKETIDNSLLEKFKLYFDESYKDDIAAIERLRSDYTTAYNSLLTNIQSLSNVFNDENIVSNLYLEIKKNLEVNIKIIEEKLKKSNEKKTIISVNAIEKTIEKINIVIHNKNEDYDNLDINKRQFENDIWFFLSNDRKDAINKFDDLGVMCGRIATSVEKKISDVNDKIICSKKLIEDLREQTISTKDAVEKINIILNNSGFQGFKIEEKELSENNIAEYYLKRIDGSDVEVFKSLSEGEKNFIAFLYFYQLCLGTNSIEESTRKKIIVIDDPVSSLDSQVLFIVNSLIQQLIARKGSSKPEKKEFKNNFLVQAFILTHNIYFFKEVSLDNQRTCMNRTFYKISKINNISKIEVETKPLLNDYSLLWDSLNKMKANIDTSPTDKTHNISIANTMRRVLESYVNFTGLGASVWDAIKDSDPEDVINIICSSLISEIQDGSHKVSPLDDIYFTRIMNEAPQKLFYVFELIFNTIGEEHYKVMMGIETDEI